MLITICVANTIVHSVCKCILSYMYIGTHAVLSGTPVLMQHADAIYTCTLGQQSMCTIILLDCAVLHGCI